MLVLQSSQLSCFYECPRKWYYQYVTRRTVPPTDAMQMGTTFHNLCEGYYKFSVPVEKLCGYLKPELVKYFSTVFPIFMLYIQHEEASGYNTITIDSTPAIETEFNMQLSEDVVYKGKIDRIAEFNHSLYFMDWKFTSMYLGDAFFNPFEMSPQVLSYSYVGQRHFTHINGFVIDAISLPKSGKPGFEKRYYPLVPVIDEFVSETLAIAAFMKNNVGNKEAFMHNRKSCINKYGKKCPYYDVCISLPSRREYLLGSSMYIDTQLIYDEV